jgi:hypothetical protein
MGYLVLEGFEFKMPGDTTLVKTAWMTHFTHPPVIASAARRSRTGERLPRGCAARNDGGGNDPSGVLAGLWVD